MNRDVLTSKLARLRGTLRLALAAAGAAAPAIALLAWFVGGLLLDKALEPDRAVRAGLLIAAWGAVAWLLVVRVVSPLARKFPDDDLAAVVERHWPDLENRVISAVQFARLSEQEIERLDMSPRLVAQVRADAEGLTQHLDFRQAVAPMRAWTGPAAVALALAVPALVAALFPAEWDLWLRRSLLLEDVERPRRVTLALREPDKTDIVRRKGDAVTVVVEAAEGSDIPEAVRIHGTGGGEGGTTPTTAGGGRGGGWFGDGSVVLSETDQIGPRRFRGVLRNLRSDVEFTARGGDGETPSVRVRVAEAVDIAVMTLDCRRPEYLDDGPMIRKWGAPLELPPGTRVIVAGEATKDLSAVEVRVPRTPADAVTFDGLSRIDTPDPAVAAVPLPGSAVKGRSFRFEFTVLAGTALEVVLRDTDGLTNFHSGDGPLGRPVRIEIEVRPDRAPTGTLVLEGIGDLVTPAARVPMNVRVRDDHGLRSARVVALRAPDAEALAADRNAQPVALSPALPLSSPSTPFGKGVRDVEFPDTVWEIGDLGLQPGQIIELDVQAEDFRETGKDPDGKPVHALGRTDPALRRRLTVVGAEALLGRMVEELLKARGELDLRIRAQVGLLADLEKAAEDDKSDAISDATYALIRKVSAGQQRLADDMNRLRRGLAGLLAELDNNRVWTDGDERRRKLERIVDDATRLSADRLALLHGPDGPEKLLVLLPDTAAAIRNWDVDADGRIDLREWARMRELLDLVDPNRDFESLDPDGSPGDPGELFRSVAQSRPAITADEAARARLATGMRRLYLRTAAAAQIDSLERMRRMRMLLPQDQRFAAVLQKIETLLSRQRDALQATRRAGDRAAEDVFDDK